MWLKKLAEDEAKKWRSAKRKSCGHARNENLTIAPGMALDDATVPKVESDIAVHRTSTQSCCTQSRGLRSRRRFDLPKCDPNTWQRVQIFAPQLDQGDKKFRPCTSFLDEVYHIGASKTRIALQRQSSRPHHLTMALRARGRVLLDAANKGETVLIGEGGLRGFMHRVRERLATGKLLRPDVEDDVLRKPVGEAKFRFPSPGYVCARNER